jgi:hypothetical protein
MATSVKPLIIDSGSVKQAASSDTIGAFAAASVAISHNTAWDGTTGQNLTVNVNGSAFTIANPSSAVTGAFYSLYVTFTTSHAIAFGNAFKNVTDLTPSNTAGMYDHFVFRYDGTYMICVASAYDVRRA